MPEVIDSTIESSIASIEGPNTSTESPIAEAAVSVEAAEPPAIPEVLQPEASSFTEAIVEQSLSSRLAHIPSSLISFEYWRQVLDELFSERTVTISQRDITVAAMQSAAAGAAVVGLVIALVRPR